MSYDEVDCIEDAVADCGGRLHPPIQTPRPCQYGASHTACCISEAYGHLVLCHLSLDRVQHIPARTICSAECQSVSLGRCQKCEDAHASSNKQGLL